MTCQNGTGARPAGTSLWGGVCTANGTTECGATCCTGGACCVNGTCASTCLNGQPCVNGACSLTCPWGGFCQGATSAGCPSPCACATTSEGVVVCINPDDVRGSFSCPPFTCTTTADCPSGSACIPIGNPYCSCGAAASVRSEERRVGKECRS